jgi:DNA-binding protein Fis
MRAVVLCGGDRIEAADLELESDPAPEASATGPRSGEASLPGGVEAVLEALSGQIDAALRDEDFPPPIGKWLGEDLVLEAYRAAGETASRAAALLAIPETTFRRRLQKARAVAGLSPRPEGWERVRERIASLAATGSPTGDDLLDRLRLALLAEVERRVSGDARRAAALLGITEPTYRRWLASYNNAS